MSFFNRLYKTSVISVFLGYPERQQRSRPYLISSVSFSARYGQFPLAAGLATLGVQLLAHLVRLAFHFDGKK